MNSYTTPIRKQKTSVRDLIRSGPPSNSSSSTTSPEVQSQLQNAAKMASKCIKDDTKYGYENKLATIQRYFATYCNSTGPLTPPLVVDHVMGFFGYICESAHPKTLCYGAVASYRSALKWLYRKHSILWSEKLEMGIQTILQGNNFI